MNMIYLILYASGVITTLSVIGILYYKHINKQLSQDLQVALSGIVKSKEPERRVANLIWGGWHNALDPSYKWESTFELKEVAMSEDETKSKFEVISVISENPKDAWGKEKYAKYFYENYNGGWVDMKNIPKQWQFDWVITKSKADIRGEKIDDILNTK